MEKAKTKTDAEDAEDVAAPVVTEDDGKTGREMKSDSETVEVKGRTQAHKLRSAEKISGYISKFTGKKHAEFKSGDTVRVHYKIVEGNKERIQVFEGVVIAIRHSGLDKTFTVRKVSWNIGVERTFFYNSHKVDKIEVVRRGKVNRAKIYYLRKRVGKAARIKELRKPKTT